MLTVPPLPHPTASTKNPQVYKPKLVAIGIELAVVWEAICQANVTEFCPQELKKYSLMQHHNEASNDSDLVKMDDHYSDDFFDFDDESECDYIITLPEDQTDLAESTLLKTVGATWLKSDKREDHLAIRPWNIVHKYVADGSLEFFIVIIFLIDNHGGLVREHMPGRYAELDQYCWADEFSQQHGGAPNAWALSFERQNGTVVWAFKLQHMMSVDRMAGANILSLAAMEQTQMSAHTLAQNTNPKFQARPAGGDWANEYQQQYNTGPSSTSSADQYAREEASKTFILLILSIGIQ
ncbi:unnamed protein product [Lactuca saligna]|uniref:Uncharacterized protein n=1 Tax=Lactuca saligna TaxID=75948 RepID=A0AA35Z286_LACSI|nr:unnamed protein product [Lactuca saligna]